MSMLYQDAADVPRCSICYRMADSWLGCPWMPWMYSDVLVVSEWQIAGLIALCRWLYLDVNDVP